ncbi:MAG TPA: IS701 family transposase [Nanoarchaeota archaeon]|nr:IS701 family transposase [Nanoarchaeota archaeon]
MNSEFNLDTFALDVNLSELYPIEIKMVCKTPLEPLWDYVVKNYHYLGYERMFGSRLKYLVFHKNRLIAALSFNQAALKIESRDCFIGWDKEQKKKYLPFIVNNNRFLVMPWIRVKNLASHVLSKTVSRLKADWYRLYNKEPLLIETFVDKTKYKGTCYLAANWRYLGQTRGFTKAGDIYTYHGNTKGIFVYPLKRNFRKIINCQERPYHRPLKNTGERVSEIMMLHNYDWNPDIIEQAGITEKEVEKLTSVLEDFVADFKECFRRTENSTNGHIYLKGLLSDLERKSIEPIALRYLGPSSVRGLQNFMKNALWDDEKMLDIYQKRLSSTVSDPEAMITVDGCDIPKKGKKSAGVARQYCGSLGKVENCQAGVFVGYSNPKGYYGLINCQLYMPEKWFSDEYKNRFNECDVPKDLKFKTKIEIANDLIKEASESSLFPARWVGCDGFFGTNKEFLDSLPENIYYFADVHSNVNVWLEKPEVFLPEYKGRGPHPKKLKAQTAPISVSDIAKIESIPWQKVILGDGAKGPIYSQVKCVRVYECRDDLPGNECWLYIRKLSDGKIKCSLSNAPIDTPKETFNKLALMRWPIEQSFKDGKKYLGMDHYESRSWKVWHRHMLFVFLAQLFLLEIRIKFKKKFPS